MDEATGAKRQSQAAFSYTPSTIAGGAYTQSTIGSDRGRNVYNADSGNNRVLKEA